MAQNLIDSFTAYIENLCRHHTVIGHTDNRKHFVDLSTDELLQEGKSLVYYPVVTIQKLTNSYDGREDALRKTRYVELMFLDHLQDRGSFKQMEKAWAQMEQVAEDFLRRIRIDRRDRQAYPWLRSVSIEKAEGDYVENVVSHLWGYLLTFDLDMPFDNCIEPGRFDDL